MLQSPRIIRGLSPGHISHGSFTRFVAVSACRASRTSPYTADPPNAISAAPSPTARCFAWVFRACSRAATAAGSWQVRHPAFASAADQPTTTVASNPV
jgi:hypothetical protein